VFKYLCEVRFRDLDGLGHLNNAVYHSFLEQARCHFFKQIGLFDPSNGIKNLPIILARTEIDYVAPCYFGDKLTVKTWVKEIGNKSFKMSYQILSEKESKEVAKATATLVYYDNFKQKSSLIPDETRRALNDFII